MNYLAHIFLSGDDGRIQLGNFIADAVKGNSYMDYPQPIIDGILLHRAIDGYTDKHPAVREVVRSLRPYFGRYSGVVLDIFFDYLLASRFREFAGVPLRRYTRRFYLTLIRNRRYLPARIKRFMWHFIGTDRLSRYAEPAGIRRSLEIMVGVHRIDVSVDTAMDYLAEHEEELMGVFRPFFTELQTLCSGYIDSDDRTEYLKVFRSAG